MMARVISLTTVCMLLAFEHGPACAQTVLWNFNSDPTGSLPPDWSNGWNLDDPDCDGGQSCDVEHLPWGVSGGKLRPPLYSFNTSEDDRHGEDTYAESQTFMSMPGAIVPVDVPVAKVSVSFNQFNLGQDSQTLDSLSIELLQVGTSKVLSLLEIPYLLGTVGLWTDADKADGKTDGTFTRQVPIEPGVKYRLRVRAQDNDTQVGSFEGIAIDDVAVTNGVIISGFIESGDFDGDGDVDGEDFLNWQRHVSIAGSVTVRQGDANGDGLVSGLDLAIWRDQFVSPMAVASGAAAPEPTAIGLALATLALAPFRRLRRPDLV